MHDLCCPSSGCGWRHGSKETTAHNASRRKASSRQTAAPPGRSGRCHSPHGSSRSAARPGSSARRNPQAGRQEGASTTPSSSRPTMPSAEAEWPSRWPFGCGTAPVVEGPAGPRRRFGVVLRPAGDLARLAGTHWIPAATTVSPHDPASNSRCPPCPSSRLADPGDDRTGSGPRSSAWGRLVEDVRKQGSCGSRN